jgi:hypothetical protein
VGWPTLVYGDAQADTAQWLETALRARPESWASSATVGTRVPAKRSLGDPGYPYVMVRQDGPGEARTRALVVVQLLVTVWADDEDRAYDLCQLAHGLLLSYSSAVVRSVLPNLPPYPDADLDTGEPVASCTVTANLRPTVL